MATEFKKKGDWKRFEIALEPGRYDKVMKKHVGKALELSALFVVSMIRDGIKDGDFDENALLTREIKGSSKPLVDKGDLWQAITHTMVDEFRVFVGLNRTERGGGKRGKKDTYNIGITLHEGVTVKVTDKMRALFFYLWLASVDPGRYERKLKGRAKELWERKKGGWRKLEKGFVRIPGRPFIKAVFDDPGVKAKVEKILAAGVDAGFREQAGA